MNKLNSSHMQKLLAEAKEKKKQESIEKLAAKVREESIPSTDRYPNAPTVPKKEQETVQHISMQSDFLKERLTALRKDKETKQLQFSLQQPKEKEHENTIPTNNPNPASNSGIDFRERLSNLRDKQNKGQLTKSVSGLTGTEVSDEKFPNTGAEPATKSTQNVAPLDKYGNNIVYNKEQQQFVDIASAGKSCVLIGAAGTGKTTCTQGAIQSLIASGTIPVLQAEDHKYLVSGTPGVIVIAYTRRAVNNIKKVLPADIKNNCITAHKLLEYEPVYYEIEDPETGEFKKTMRFEPSRNSVNPLPSSISTVIIEESSMFSLELFAELKEALPQDIQWIFLGDIQQLPPVFGSAVLGFKMLELPVVELVQVYRQALESPIIRLAHRILSGKVIKKEELEDWHAKGQLTLHPWKKKLAPDTALMTLAAFFTKALDNGVYNPDEDMILIPFNKACGTIELNKYIANHIARKTGETTYEVMAGFNKHYFSVGDKVLYDKEDAEIVEIKYNAAYTGARVQPESKTLDYWGHNPNLASESYSNDYGNDDIDFLLAQVESAEDRVTQSSHSIVVKLLDSEVNVTLTKAAEVNSLLHSYALTIHKSQGSEWRKVFLTLHQSHAKMLQRELLYTAVTRAREELYVICEPESFVKGITSQRIKGNTLAEKAEFFKGKIKENEEILE